MLATLSRWRPRVQIPSGPQARPASSTGCGPSSYPPRPVEAEAAPAAKPPSDTANRVRAASKARIQHWMRAFPMRRPSRCRAPVRPRPTSGAPARPHPPRRTGPAHPTPSRPTGTRTVLTLSAALPPAPTRPDGGPAHPTPSRPTGTRTPHPPSRPRSRPPHPVSDTPARPTAQADRTWTPSPSRPTAPWSPPIRRARQAPGHPHPVQTDGHLATPTRPDRQAPGHPQLPPGDGSRTPPTPAGRTEPSCAVWP